MSHYSETHRWSHIHNALVLNESWNDKEEVARLTDRLEAAEKEVKRQHEVIQMKTKLLVEAINREDEQAAQIEALRVAKLALHPFAECCDQIDEAEDDNEWAKFRLIISDYRAANKALAAIDALPTVPAQDALTAYGERVREACKAIAQDEAKRVDAVHDRIADDDDSRSLDMIGKAVCAERIESAISEMPLPKPDAKGI